MKIGAWIHGGGGISLDEQIALAAENGLQSIRSYGLAYAEQVAPALRQHGLSLLAGIHVESAALLHHWRSQVRLDEIARCHELGLTLEAICVGNELREGGDAPQTKRFTARLSFGLANVLATYRRWLDDHGYSTPLTYAMEGIVLDREGYFYEWLWPLIDACDIVSINAYPMGHDAWFTFGAFEESRRFLHDPRARHDRLALFELHLRRALQQLEGAGKPVFLSETGFPSAVGYQLEGEQRVVPQSDNEGYGRAMREFAALLRRVNTEYNRRIQALYFYEWRDNLFHDKIWNVEQSPIHVAFGLCDRMGVPKFDIGALVGILQGGNIP
jgi:exo-beta-1,3-glucanase (GH17 family)